METVSQTEKRWTDVAKNQFLNKKIVAVRYLSQKEADALGWYHRPIVLQLDDGNLVFPSRDDEGNDGGSLFTNDDKQPVIPVI